AFRDDSSKSAGTSTLPSPGGMPPRPSGPGGKAPPPPMGDLGGPGTKDHVQKDPVEDDYPKPEEQLRQLAKTLEVLKGKTAKEVAAPPARFRGDGVDLFSKPSESSSSGTGGDTPTKPGGTDDPDGSDKKDPPKLEVPEY